VGTTIFTVMSALAQETGAVNLGQGFPDFDCDPALLSQVTAAMREGLNQYPPMAGVPPLRQAVSDKINTALRPALRPGQRRSPSPPARRRPSSRRCCACVHPGDEVIVLEPCYDSYAPNIELAGGTVVRVPLTPGSFRPDFARIAAALTPRTRLIIINSPHNPSATVWTRAEMQQLADLLAPTQVLLISDEVYEHMVFDGRRTSAHRRLPALAARAFVVSSFGKTYHVTGWKVGTVVAPAALMAEFRKVHQFNVFTVNTPMQHGLARFMADPAPYLQPAGLSTSANATSFAARPGRHTAACAGHPGQLFPAGGLQRRERPASEAEFCLWLTREVGVAAIPLSAFYDAGFEQGLARLCFAKRDETLKAALQRLARL
jgi:methionine aminotransferase